MSKQIGLSKLILQHRATRGNRCRRIGALEKVAGSIPVGHPPKFRIQQLACWLILSETQEHETLLQRPEAQGA
jgi:hypothetical protein